METPVPKKVTATVDIRPWLDPLVEACGFGPASGYVEYCWLPILGPTATWLYRRLGSLVLVHVDGCRVELPDLATSLGLGAGLGRNSPLMRALDRLAHFEVVTGSGSVVLVRRALAPLSERHASRLPSSARRAHEQAARTQARELP